MSAIPMFMNRMEYTTRRHFKAYLTDVDRYHSFLVVGSAGAVDQQESNAGKSNSTHAADCNRTWGYFWSCFP